MMERSTQRLACQGVAAADWKRPVPYGAAEVRSGAAPWTAARAADRARRDARPV